MPNPQALFDSIPALQAVLSSLPSRIAVINSRGTIVLVNEAWSSCAARLSKNPAACSEGANYLDVCRNASGPGADQARRVHRGLKRLLSGESNEFNYEYPCHTPEQQCWYLLQASPIRDGSGAAVVSHLDITHRVRAEHELRRERDFSERLIDTAQNVVLVLDQMGRIVRFNRYLEQLTGRQLDEVRNQDWFETFIPARVRSCAQGDFQKALGDALTQDSVHPIVSRDGQEREIAWSHARLIDLEGQPNGLLCTGLDVTERRKLERQILEVSAAEQRRIGLELHDGTQQQVAGLGMISQTVVNGLEQLLQQDHLDETTRTTRHQTLAKLLRRAQKVQQGLEQIARDVHQLARGLIPVELDAQGLMSSLRELTVTMNECGRMHCRFECDGDIEIDDNYTATQLFRIAQEAVQNATKHSQGTELQIFLRKNRDFFELIVADDGCGITGSPTDSRCMGLKIMAYRATLIGATLRTKSRAQGGTEIVCRLPSSLPELHPNGS